MIDLNSIQHTDDENNICRSQITEHEGNYRYISPVMHACYNSLPLPMCKMTNILFGKLLNSKEYGKRKKMKLHSKNEDKRIYTDFKVNISDITERYYHVEYSSMTEPEKANAIEMDKSNVRKILNKIHDNNIFYIWNCFGNYIFFLEREISSWRYYNSTGYLYPRTLNKIFVLCNNILDKMVSFQDKESKTSGRYGVNISFAHFISDLVSKMNPEVAKKFPTLPSGNAIPYLREVCQISKECNNFEGAIIAPDFIKRIPIEAQERWYSILSQRNKNNKNDEEEEIPIMNKQSDMEKELVPNNSNVCRNKALRGNSDSKNTANESATDKSFQVQKFSNEIGTNPFEGSNHFVEYYKAAVSVHSSRRKDFKSPNFNKLVSELIPAGKILDALTEMGKKNDKLFLDEWIKFYVDYRLKGDRITKRKHTSLVEFETTLHDFKNKFSVKEH